MIKVIVGDEKAEWMVHEKILLANSGFARAAVSHNTEEKASGTIFLPEASPEIFDVFHKYLYEKRLYVAELDLDHLFLVYVLADYVDCPVFADLVFEVIYLRTTSSSLVSYTHKQIQKVLTSTLPDQPLHKLMLDQISLQILQRKHNFDSNEAQETLQQVTGEVLVSLVQTINRIRGASFSNVQLPIGKYSKHVSRHASLEHVPNGAQPAQPFEPAPTLAADESPEARIGRIAVECVMAESARTKEDAIKALEDHNYNSEEAITSLKPRLNMFGRPADGSGISATPNSTLFPSLVYSSPITNSTPTQYSPDPPIPTTPAASRGRGGSRGRGTGQGRGGAPRGRGGSG